MTSRVAAVAVAAALVAAACSNSSVFDSIDQSQLGSTTAATTTSGSGSTLEPAPTGGSAGPAAAIETVDCPSLLRGSALTCGLATVPLDHENPLAGSTSISLVVMSGSDSGFDTPVAVLQGGPGGASTELASWFPQREFTQVFIDQRGTGFAPTQFDCPEADNITTEILALDSDTALVRESDAYKACAVRFEANPALPYTNTAAMAADVEAVMAGLGNSRWVVYGVSYGTTIGLDLLRRGATGMVGAVLDGVYPPDLDVDQAIAFSADRSIAALDRACAASEDCSKMIDGVSATLDRVISELDADPIHVKAGGGAPETIIDGQRAAVFTFLMLYGDQELTFIPWMLAGLDKRDPDAARWAARVGNLIETGSAQASDEATYFAVNCHDRAPFTNGPPDSLDPFAAAIALPPTSEICAPWQVGSAQAAEGDPVESDIPTLLMAGGFDPITPADFARSAAEHLSNSVVVEQAGRGHGIWYGNDCIGDIVLSFVSDPARQLDTSCASEPVSIDWRAP